LNWALDHLVFLAFAFMHWLLIALLVSLGALLLAAGGILRHIRLQRARLRSKGPAHAARTHDEADLESES
jgi:hypothetical protein